MLSVPVLSLLMTGAANAQFVPSFTPADLLTIGMVFNTAWEAFADINSLINGTDANIASLINDAKDAIIADAHGSIAQELEDDVESSVRDWFEISQTLTQFPDGNNTVMIARISDVLDRTQSSWVSLKNILDNSNPDTVYRVVTAFNVVAALRTTILKDMGQLVPPMPVAQSAIDQVFKDTMQTDYNVVGARILYAWFSAYENTVRGKGLHDKFVGQSSWVCTARCDLHVVLNQNPTPYICGGLSHDATTTCTGGECGQPCGNGTCGVTFPNGIEYWVFGPCPLAPQDAGVWSVMDADPVVQLVKDAMRGIIRLGQGPGVGGFPFYNLGYLYVLDPTYVPGATWGQLFVSANDL